MKRILLCNDDGVNAPGIRAMVAALQDLAEVTVVAPLNEQSASSHALTIHSPLRIRKIDERVWAVDGTPTDCVLLAIREFLDEQPDLVVSGINQGPNLGEDVLYSGTVSAAMEGALLGVASVAFSLFTYGQPEAGAMEAAAPVARRVVERLLARDLPPRLLVNVNIPPGPVSEIKGFRLSRLGSRVYNDAIVKKTDPRGKPYYWIGGAEPTWEVSPDSDHAAVKSGYVSMTPLLLDLTDATGFGFLSTLGLEWP